MHLGSSSFRKERPALNVLFFFSPLSVNSCAQGKQLLEDKQKASRTTVRLYTNLTSNLIFCASCITLYLWWCSWVVLILYILEKKWNWSYFPALLPGDDYGKNVYNMLVRGLMKHEDQFFRSTSSDNLNQANLICCIIVHCFSQIFISFKSV